MRVFLCLGCVRGGRYVHIHIYIYIYIYICRERDTEREIERDRYRTISLSLYIYIYMGRARSPRSLPVAGAAAARRFPGEKHFVMLFMFALMYSVLCLYYACVYCCLLLILLLCIFCFCSGSREKNVTSLRRRSGRSCSGCSPGFSTSFSCVRLFMLWSNHMCV